MDDVYTSFDTTLKLLSLSICSGELLCESAGVCRRISKALRMMKLHSGMRWRCSKEDTFDESSFLSGLTHREMFHTTKNTT